MKNKPLKIVGLILGVMVILWGVAAISVRFLLPPEKIKALVLPKIEKQLGRDVKVENVGVSVFPYLGAGITGLSIAETRREGFSRSPFVSIEEFRVRIALMSLLQGKAEIAEITVIQPRIKVEVDSTGEYNFDDLAVVAQDTNLVQEKDPERKKSLPIPLALNSFGIRDGRIEYTNRQKNETIVLGSINQETKFSIDKNLSDVSATGELTIDEIILRAKGLSTPLENLTMTVDHDIGANIVEGTAEVHRVRASVQDVYMNLSGSVANFHSAPEVDLVITTDTLSIAHLLKIVPSELAPELAGATGSGDVFFRVNAQGPIDSARTPDLNGILRVGNARISYPDLPESINDIEVALDFTADSVKISRLSLNLGKNPISVKGWARNFSDPEVAANVRASVNLDDLKDIVPVPEGNTVKGEIDADIDAQGQVDPSNPAALKLNGTIGLKNVVTVTPAVTKPVVTNGTIQLASDAIVPRLDIQIGTSSMEFDGHLKDWLSLVLPDSTAPRPLLSFTMNSPLMNTDEFLPESEATASEGQNQGATEAAGVLVAGTMSPVDLKGRIRNQRLIYKGIELSNVTSNVSLSGNVIDMNVTGGMYRGTMNNAVHLDASKAPRLYVKSSIDADGVEVGQMVSGLSGLLPAENALVGHLRNLGSALEGNGSMKGTFTTRGTTADNLTNALDGKMTGVLNNGKIAKGPLTRSVSGVLGKFVEIQDLEYSRMATTVRIAEGRVIVESMDISSNQTGQWDVDGSVGFDATLDLEIANRLPKGPSSTLVKAQSSARQAGQSLIAAALGEKAANLAGEVTRDMGIPVDRDGRVTVVVGLGGTISSPKASDFTFKEGSGTAPASKPARNVQTSAKKQVTEKVQEAKEQAQQRIEEEKRRLREETRKKAQEQQKAAEEELKKKANDAAETLKKLF